jgi:hypothetical protein
MMGLQRKNVLITNVAFAMIIREGTDFFRPIIPTLFALAPLRSVPQAGSQFPSFPYFKGFYSGKAMEL